MPAGATGRAVLTRGAKIAIGAGVVIILAAGVAGGIKYRNRPKGTSVHTVRVESRDLVSLVTASGTIAARTKVDVSANIMGQVTRLDVEEGDSVRRGDLLLVIDPARYAAAVDSRRAAIESLEAELARVREGAAQAKRDLDRADKQYREQILPAAEYDRARSVWEQAVASVQTVERQISQARAELDSVRDELAKTEIRAPMDGVVTRRNIEQGEVVVTGTMNNPGTVLMTISDMSVIEAVLEVDQTDVPQLRVGQKASVLIDAYPDTPFPAVVSEIGSSPIQGSSALTGTATGTDYEVKVTLDTVPENLRPGLTVTADIVTATRANALTVPIGALVLREKEEAATPAPADAERERSTTIDQPASVASRTRDIEGVYVVKGTTVEFRPVTTGIKGELDVEIIAGLEKGQEVVTGPFKALREIKPGSQIVVDNTVKGELET